MRRIGKLDSYFYTFTQKANMVALELLNATFVLIVAGQSNTLYGNKLERAKDDLDFSRILQIPSAFLNDNQPLLTSVHEGNIGHYTPELNRIGFITRTAVRYRDNDVGKNGRVVIIPAGFGGSGWSDQLYDKKIPHWRADGPLFQNLVKRINYARDQLFGKFPAFLWHQGESDVGTKNYAFIIRTFIVSMREHIGILDCPFVLGEMARRWVGAHPQRKQQQQIINSVQLDVPYTAVVKSHGLYSTQVDPIHFSADDQRVLSTRYYEAIKKAKSNRSPPYYVPISGKTHVIFNHQISTGHFFAHVLDTYHYGLHSTDPKYSRLGDLWRYRNNDGWYKFELHANQKKITWRQKINPLGSWREGYTPIQLLENTLGITEDRFQGLYVKGGATAAAIPTLLSADTNPSTWFFAVGSVHGFAIQSNVFVHALNQFPLIVADRITLCAIID